MEKRNQRPKKILQKRNNPSTSPSAASQAQNDRTNDQKSIIMITLKEGDKAPAFISKDQNGKKISLSDYKGKKLFCFSIPKPAHLPARLNRAT